MRQHTFSNIHIRDRRFADLNPVILGWDRCAPSYAFGPTVREYYLMHYIVSGGGCFENARGRYDLSPGQIFLIRPGEVTYYRASDTDPWHYIWIGFTGALAARLEAVPDVLTLSAADRFPAMLRCTQLDSMREEYLAGQLFLLFAELFGEKAASSARAPGYTERVFNYIEKNYMQQLSVEALASEMNINRRYLSRIFRQDYGMSVKEYITAVKMKHAKSFLADGCSVSQAAAMTGYNDVFNFSKMFKKHFGYSPSTVRSTKTSSD